MKPGFSLQDLKKIDRSNMLGLILDFPEQCQQAMAIANKIELTDSYKDFKNIVFCGMGGSAIGADLIKSYLYFKTKVPIAVIRDYNLPNFIDENSLVFVLSYSGDTEETLSSYVDALKREAKIIAVSSGGKLKQQTLQDGFCFVEIPKGFPPRTALGFLSIVPLVILAKLMNLGINKEIEQTISLLKNMQKVLRPQTSLTKNIAKKTALNIQNKFAVIYASSTHFDVAATRLRGQLAENAKHLSSMHLLPEMNHNEIVGWQNPKSLFKDFLVIFLRDKNEHPRVQKRIEITQKILQKEKVNCIELWSQGNLILERIFSLIYTADFISFYLALLNKIDPTPVERISFLKKELAKNK